jgi:hypothetical protein
VTACKYCHGEGGHADDETGAWLSCRRCRRCDVKQGQHGIPHDCPEALGVGPVRVRWRDLPIDYELTDKGREALA